MADYVENAVSCLLWQDLLDASLTNLIVLKSTKGVTEGIVEGDRNIMLWLSLYANA